MSDYSKLFRSLSAMSGFTDIMHSGRPPIYMTGWSSQREVVEP